MRALRGWQEARIVSIRYVKLALPEGRLERWRKRTLWSAGSFRVRGHGRTRWVSVEGVS